MALPAYKNTENRRLYLLCAAAWQREAAAQYEKSRACLASGYIRRAIVLQHVARQAYETSALALDGIKPGSLKSEPAPTMEAEASTDAKSAALRAAIA
jgi:hypothetical protein